MKKIYIIAAMAFIAIWTYVGYYWAHNKLNEWVQTPIELPVITKFDLAKGSSPQAVAIELKNSGLITNEFYFQIYLRLNKNFPNFKAGHYKFENRISPIEIINDFSNGKIYLEPVFSVTIPEGFTMKQIIARLVAKGIATADDFNKIVKDKAIFEKYNIKAKSLEGYLYPSTYYFHNEKPTANQAIEIMIKEFFKRLPSDFELQLEKRKMTLNEAVIMGSLIEKETLLDDERPLIAEVILNRLKKKMSLGIDAAIIYGIEDYDGDIKWKHLRDKDNLYNNRIHKGLPPTAICSPTINSIVASLNPTSYGYLYYVKMVGEEKKHKFSSTLEEHNKYVKELVKDIKQNEQK